MILKIVFFTFFFFPLRQRTFIFAIASIVVAGHVYVESTEGLPARRGHHICRGDEGPPVDVLSHDPGEKCQAATGHGVLLGNPNTGRVFGHVLPLRPVFTKKVSTLIDQLDGHELIVCYSLSRSTSFIDPIYLEYQASETEERSTEEQPTGRRRNDTLNDEDDFIPEKRKKIAELSKSFERDLYGVSPGFHHI